MRKLVLRVFDYSPGVAAGCELELVSAAACGNQMAGLAYQRHKSSTEANK